MAMKVLRHEWQRYFLAKMRHPTAPPTADQTQLLELLKESLCTAYVGESGRREMEEEERRRKEERKVMTLSVVRNAD